MTDREKIIETLKQTSDIWKEEERHGYIVSVDLEKIADALIEAGFGYIKDLKTELRSKVDYIHEQDDVIKDYKLRAGVAEVFLALIDYQFEKMKHRAEVAEKAFLILWNECKEKLGWNIDCTMWYAKQAEKELAEEKKDDERPKKND